MGQDMNMPDNKRSQYVKQDSPERKSRSAVRSNSQERKMETVATYAELSMTMRDGKRKFELDLGDISELKMDDRQKRMMEISQKRFEKGASESNSLVGMLNNLSSSGWRVISTFKGDENTTHFLLEMQK